MENTYRMASRPHPGYIRPTNLCVLGVYYVVNESSWPDTPHEALGRFVGIADTVGAAITFKILTEDMKVISRSVVRTATRPGVFQNLRANERVPTFGPKPVNTTLKIDDREEAI